MADTSTELIILKRVEEVAEPKKGGAWKVAHADFMTAMMAFFLIMWLVNATDEEIKKSIANYFNPINLMAAPTDEYGISDPTRDTRPPASGDEAGQAGGDRPMGANTPGEGGSAAGGGNVEEGNENRMDSGGIQEETSGAAFHDPYAVLASAAADIAPEDSVAVDVPQSAMGTAGQTVTSDAPRDPFDPAYWQTTSSRPAQSLRPGPNDRRDAVPAASALDAADRTPTETPTGQAVATGVRETARGIGRPASMAIAAHNTSSAVTAQPQVGPRSALAEAVLAAYGDDGAATGVKASTEPSQDGGIERPAGRAERLADAAADIAQALAGVDADIAVSAGDTSVLISLTDDGAFSMFPIGSARPTADAGALFARVASALNERKGRIVVRGHTDARPFSSGTSDNWMLSFERAHATKTALVTNGIPESRIARVEGLADREPTNPGDPLADENRRIEILYEPAEVTP